MRTIFHSNRKRLRRPRYAIAYRPASGGLAYVTHPSREWRARFEQTYHGNPYFMAPALYRINVYPKALAKPAERSSSGAD